MPGVDGAVPATRCLVMLPHLKRRKKGAQPTTKSVEHTPENKLAEAVGLAQAIDLEVADHFIVPLPTVRPATLFGKGKIDELQQLIEREDVELVIIDHTVTPVQQRNLERAWDVKILDRTGLILEIFGRRAQTREGQLQVELAHLTYQKGRLVRAWTHLERQRGGGGFIGGPGEAQIELDRRMINARISSLRKELNTVVKTRALHRAGRRKVPYPVVAIVGYTNAGKSTLFNYLTGAKVFAKQQVFATLDPTMREVRLSSGRRAILSDTVGFISDLPTMLVAAFRATLEEVISADLILHVRDISHPETIAQAADVDKVLEDLGIDTKSDRGHIVEVWNKADLLSDEERQVVVSSACFESRRPCVVSSKTGEGMERLLATIDRHLGKGDQIFRIEIPAIEGRLLHWLHEHGEVIERTTGEDALTTYTVRIAAEKHGAFQRALVDASIVAEPVIN